MKALWEWAWGEIKKNAGPWLGGLFQSVWPYVSFAIAAFLAWVAARSDRDFVFIFLLAVSILAAGFLLAGLAFRQFKSASTAANSGALATTVPEPSTLLREVSVINERGAMVLPVLKGIATANMDRLRVAVEISRYDDAQRPSEWKPPIRVLVATRTDVIKGTPVVVPLVLNRMHMERTQQPFWWGEADQYFANYVWEGRYRGRVVLDAGEAEQYIPFVLVRVGDAMRIVAGEELNQSQWGFAL